MRLVVGSLRETIVVSDGHAGDLNIPSIGLGVHEFCGGHVACFRVSPGWKILACRACNLRQEFPEKIVSVEVLRDYLVHLWELGYYNQEIFARKSICQTALTLALDFRVSGGPDRDLPETDIPA